MVQERARLEDADARLRALYDVSKLLVGFETIEQTVPELMAVMTRAMPLRSGICLARTGGRTAAIVYHPFGEEVARVDAARIAARERYVYLTGRDHDAPDEPARTPIGPDGLGVFVTLPLVVSGAPVFGVLQVDAVAVLGEADLSFVREIVEQLARAVAREHTRQLHRFEMKEAFRAERVANDRLAFTRAVTRSLGEAIIVTDVRARITLFNPAAEELLGWTEAEALGRPAPEVFRVARADRIPLDASVCPLTRTVQTGVAVQDESAHLLGRAGAAFSARYTATPLRDGRRVCGAVLVFQDTTELKRAERQDRFHAALGSALAEHLDRDTLLRATVGAIVPEIADVCVVDELGSHGALRRAEASTPDEAARRVLVCLAADGAPQRRVIESGTAILFEDVPHHAPDDGSADEVSTLRTAGVQSLLAVPLAARGRLLGVLTIGTVREGARYSPHDVRFAEEIGSRIAMALDNVALYAQAQAAVRSRENLLGLVSHDLRAPLHVITLRAGQLLREARTGSVSARTERHARAINGAADRMTRMVGDLLDMASIDAGHLSVRPRPERTGTIVAEAVELMTPIAAESAVRIVVDPEAEDVAVLCDRERVLQVLTNLIGNAIKFAGAAKLVIVRVERWRNEACIAVADRGPGIPPEQAAHLFDSFWQAPDTAHLGTGLGLAIVKGIVEALGGRVWLESTVGAGTTFFFTLPVCDEQRRPDDAGPGITRDRN